MTTNAYFHRENPIKLKVVIPVNTSLFNEAIFDVVRSVASLGTVIDIENIRQGSPFIENKYHSALNAPHVVELVKRAEAEGFDGVYVCDMDMCGVDAARTQVRIPVQGGFSTSIPQAVSFGRFSILSITSEVAEMQREYAHRFGGANNLVSIRHTHLHVHDLSRPELVFEEMYGAAIKAIDDDGACALVFGCSGFFDMAQRITERLARERDGFYIPIVDPNRAAILALEMQVKCRLSHRYQPRHSG